MPCPHVNAFYVSSSKFSFPARHPDTDLALRCLSLTVRRQYFKPQLPTFRGPSSTEDNISLSVQMKGHVALSCQTSTGSRAATAASSNPLSITSAESRAPMHPLRAILTYFGFCGPGRRTSSIDESGKAGTTCKWSHASLTIVGETISPSTTRLCQIAP